MRSRECVYVRLKNRPIGKELFATSDTQCPKASLGPFSFRMGFMKI